VSSASPGLTGVSIALGLPLVQILVPTPGAVINEGGGPGIVDFRVMNNYPINTLILDYAFASITPVLPTLMTSLTSAVRTAMPAW
jgi:hypothetical protein